MARESIETAASAVVETPDPAEAPLHELVPLPGITRDDLDLFRRVRVGIGGPEDTYLSVLAVDHAVRDLNVADMQHMTEFRPGGDTSSRASAQGSRRKGTGRKGSKGTPAPKPAAGPYTPTVAYAVDPEVPRFTDVAVMALDFEEGLVELLQGDEETARRSLLPWGEQALPSEERRSAAQSVVLERFQDYMTAEANPLSLEALPDLSPRERLHVLRMAMWAREARQGAAWLYVAGLTVSSLAQVAGRQVVSDKMRGNIAVGEDGSELPRTWKDWQEDARKIGPVWGTEPVRLAAEIGRSAHARFEHLQVSHDSGLAVAKHNILQANGRMRTESRLWEERSGAAALIEATQVEVRYLAEPVIADLRETVQAIQEGATVFLEHDDPTLPDSAETLVDLIPDIDVKTATKMAALFVNLRNAAMSNEQQSGQSVQRIWRLRLLSAVKAEAKSAQHYDQLAGDIQRYEAEVPADAPRQVPLWDTIKLVMTHYRRVRISTSSGFAPDDTGFDTLEMWLHESGKVFDSFFNGTYDPSRYEVTRAYVARNPEAAQGDQAAATPPEDEQKA